MCILPILLTANIFWIITSIESIARIICLYIFSHIVWINDSWNDFQDLHVPASSLNDMSPALLVGQFQEASAWLKVTYVRVPCIESTLCRAPGHSNTRWWADPSSHWCFQSHNPRGRWSAQRIQQWWLEMNHWWSMIHDKPEPAMVMMMMMTTRKRCRVGGGHDGDGGHASRGDHPNLDHFLFAFGCPCSTLQKAL